MASSSVNVRGVLVILGAILEVCHGGIYRVGDSAGWTTIGNVDYKLWSATKTFKLGDVIRFEYNPQFHNVMRVTHAMYKACNATVPLESHTSGNDTITITSRGHHFFMCGVPGHCQAGQKLDINVPRHPSISASAPGPAVFVSPSVPVPAAATMTPTPSASSAEVPLRSLVLVLLSCFAVFGSFAPIV